MAVWLITDNTREAWTNVLKLLADNHPHHVDEITTAMDELAPRTIDNHLRSASRRGWITRQGDHISLRSKALIEGALESSR